jgi:hypothetical protein
MNTFKEKLPKFVAESLSEKLDNNVSNIFIQSLEALRCLENDNYTAFVYRPYNEKEEPTEILKDSFTIDIRSDLEKNRSILPEEEDFMCCEEK